MSVIIGGSFVVTWKVIPTKVGLRVSPRITLLELLRYSFFQRGISGVIPGKLVVIMLLAIVKKPDARQDWARRPNLTSLMQTAWW